MGTLIENQRPRFVDETFEFGVPPFLLWQESFEAKTIARQSTCDECRHKGSGSGETLHFHSAGYGGAHQEETGVTDGGCAGVADERHLFAGFETSGKGFGGLVLVELMMADERHTDVVMFEQNATGAGVFGEHEIHRLEHAERAGG